MSKFVDKLWKQERLVSQEVVLALNKEKAHRLELDQTKDRLHIISPDLREYWRGFLQISHLNNALSGRLAYAHAPA